MIDVSMLDNNMLQMNFQPLWISKMIKIVQSELETPLNDRQQQLEIVRFEGIDVMTFGDSERLVSGFTQYFNQCNQIYSGWWFDHYRWTDAAWIYRNNRLRIQELELILRIKNEFLRNLVA